MFPVSRFSIVLYKTFLFFVCQTFACISPFACTYLIPVNFPSIQPFIKISPSFMVSPTLTFAVPLCAFILVITPALSEIILQYSFSSIIFGFSSDFTILTIAFVPFNSIPIHAISFLTNLILFIICFVSVVYMFYSTTTGELEATSQSSSEGAKRMLSVVGSNSRV